MPNFSGIFGNGGDEGSESIEGSESYETDVELDGKSKTLYEIYTALKEQGYSGTFDEFLELMQSAEGKDGETPYIGANGNWWIGDKDTGKPSTNDAIYIVKVEVKDGRIIVTYSNGEMVVTGKICDCDGENEDGNENTESAPAPEYPFESGSEIIGIFEEPVINPDGIQLPKAPSDGYVYKDSVEQLSANWNPHTYQTSDEAYPIEYLSAGLYGFFFNDEVIYSNGMDPYSGYIIAPEMASAMPVDITEFIRDNRPEFRVPDNASSGYAYYITLNPYATWENGEKINADTYVYSMRQLLDPTLQNYRASNYFDGELAIANAEKYFMQGKISYIDNGVTNQYQLHDLVKGEDGNYYTKDGNAVFIAVDYPIDWTGSATLKKYVDTYGDSYFGLEKWNSLVAAMDGNGLVALNDETYDALLATVATNVNWGETERDAYNYLIEEIIYSDNYSFNNVGLYKIGEYELILVLEKPLGGFDLLYSLKDNWLVYEDYYEVGKAQNNATGAWISSYCTNVSNTMSYGPYKLTEYYAGMQMVLERNENWFGYRDNKHGFVDKNGNYCPMYQTTKIICMEIEDHAKEKSLFFSGELTSYELLAEDLAEYRSSDRAYAEPSGTMFFLLLNGHKKSIETRESADTFDKSTTDIETITLNSFRRALALTFDREEFASAVTPSRIGGYGLIGSAYVYDTVTGARYRDTDAAKRVLCDFYSVDVSEFDSLDDAAASITGYNPDTARRLYTQAFTEALEAGYITDSDGDGISDQTVKLEYISSASSDFMKRTFAFLNSELTKATEGTPFEGKIIIYETVPYGSSWGNPLIVGAVDVIMTGWSGDLLDPYSLTENYTDPKKQYDAKWFDSSAVSLTLNIEGEEITMSLREWSQALNGIDVVFTSGCEIFTVNLGDADAETKLEILAAIEREVLLNYNYLPMLENNSFHLLSNQVEYVATDYNPILKRGGIAYLIYNYNESEWIDTFRITEQQN